jgi:hypothetical protein
MTLLRLAVVRQPADGGGYGQNEAFFTVSRVALAKRD